VLELLDETEELELELELGELELTLDTGEDIVPPPLPLQPVVHSAADNRIKVKNIFIVYCPYKRSRFLVGWLSHAFVQQICRSRLQPPYL